MRHDIRQMTIPTVCQALDEDANYKFSEKYPDGKQFFQASKRQVPSFSAKLVHPSVNLPFGNCAQCSNETTGLRAIASNIERNYQLAPNVERLQGCTWTSPSPSRFIRHSSVNWRLSSAAEDCPRSWRKMSWAWLTMVEKCPSSG